MVYRIESRFTRGEVTRTCPVCGKEFAAKAPRHTYCSVECRGKAIGRRIGRVGNADECPHCGRRFIVRSSNQKFCSKKCYNRAKYRRWYYERGGRERMHEHAMTPQGRLENRLKGRVRRAKQKARES